MVDAPVTRDDIQVRRFSAGQPHAPSRRQVTDGVLAVTLVDASLEATNGTRPR